MSLRVLAGFAAKRQAADAVMGQLDDVQFDDAYECACCREVLELPVKLPCGHEYCRECVALVASRAMKEVFRVVMNFRKELEQWLELKICKTNISIHEV